MSVNNRRQRYVGVGWLTRVLATFFLLVPDESDTLEITEQLKEGLAGRWVHFGLALGITHDAIEDIREANCTSHESLQRVLDRGAEGKTQAKRAITWRTLAIAVDARNGGNHPLLAKTIADAHRGE